MTAEPALLEPLLELLLELLAPVLAPLAPESLTEVAEMVPSEPFAPWMTTVSPGRTADFPTPTLLVTLVALESVTLTTLPVVGWVT